MAAASGRTFFLKKNSVNIAGLRNLSVSFNNQTIDITSADDDGYTTLLAAAASKNVTISGDGVAVDDVLLALCLADTDQQYTDFTIAFPSGATLAGNFNLTTYETSGAYEDAVMCSLTLASSGAWTFTPAA